MWRPAKTFSLIGSLTTYFKKDILAQTVGDAIETPWNAKMEVFKNRQGFGVPWEQGGNSKSDGKGTYMSLSVRLSVHLCFEQNSDYEIICIPKSIVDSNLNLATKYCGLRSTSS